MSSGVTDRGQEGEGYPLWPAKYKNWAPLVDILSFSII